MIDGDDARPRYFSAQVTRRGTTPRSRSSIRTLKPAVGQAIAVVHRVGRLGHHLQLHRLSRQGERRTGSPRWAPATAVEWPMPASAPRAMRASPTTSANTKGCDRLRRICLCQAEQDGLCQDDQQGRQDRRSRPRRDLPGRSRQRGLELGSPAYWRDSQRTARRSIVMADRPPPPSSSSTSSRQDPAAAGEALKFFSWAYSKMATRWRKTSTSCRCRTPVVATDREDVVRRASRTRPASPCLRSPIEARAVQISATARSRAFAFCCDRSRSDPNAHLRSARVPCPQKPAAPPLSYVADAG